MLHITTAEESERRLKEDIEAAHARHERRLARIEELKKLPPVGTAGGGPDWSRYERATELREKGLTYKQLGQELGCSANRARQLVIIHARVKKARGPRMELSVRTLNVLRNLLGRSDITPEAISELTIEQVSEAENCGAKTLTEIRLWLQKHGKDLRPIL